MPRFLFFGELNSYQDFALQITAIKSVYLQQLTIAESSRHAAEPESVPEPGLAIVQSTAILDSFRPLCTFRPTSMYRTCHPCSHACG